MFYQKGLFNAEIDVEIAYIDFIRTIEVYNLYYKVKSTEEDLFEGDLGKIWEEISSKEDLVEIFIRYHGSTKKFINTILGFIPKDSDFWQQTESKWPDFSLSKISNIEGSLKNSYAVRSEYLHEGISIGDFILPTDDGLNETAYSEPAYKTAITSQKTLTLLGLERVVRKTLIEHIKNQKLLPDG